MATLAIFGKNQGMKKTSAASATGTGYSFFQKIGTPIKSSIKCLVALFCPFALQAQQAVDSAYDRVNDSMVARYNRGDFKAMYLLENDVFKANFPESDCLGYFSAEKNSTGNIQNSGLMTDLGPVKYYLWHGEHKNAKFELRLEDGLIKQCRLNEFVAQPGSDTVRILYNNPLKNYIDSAVHTYALIYMHNPQAQSISIGVYKDGRKYVYNYGEVKKGSGILPDGRTIYQVGSIAKTFIAILLAKAVTDQKVRLDDDVRKYLPGSYPNLAYKGHAITLKQLANHTGGFRKFNFITYPKDIDTLSWNGFMRYLNAYPKERVVQDLHNLVVDTMPGVERNYSVGGFIILGMALEQVYGKPLNSLFNEYYGNRLLMKDTKLNTDKTDLPRFATPYDAKSREELPMEKSTPGLFTVKSTVNDMLTYIEANIKEESLAILLSHKPTWGDFYDFAVGLGWEISNTWEKGLWIRHSGHDGGYNSLCSFYPQDNLGFIFLQNEDGRQGTLFTLERNLYQTIEKR